MYPRQIISALESIFDYDQEAISFFRIGKITSNQLVVIQKENAGNVKNIIAEFGFPFINKTSLKAYRAGFLTVQHSGDINFLEQTIKQFENRNEDEIVLSDKAYLIDRLCVLQNKPQVYGTQYKNENGKVIFFKIAHPEEVDKKRSELGMEDFEQYQKKVMQNSI